MTAPTGCEVTLTPVRFSCSMVVWVADPMEVGEEGYPWSALSRAWLEHIGDYSNQKDWTTETLDPSDPEADSGQVFLANGNDDDGAHLGWVMSGAYESDIECGEDDCGLGFLHEGDHKP